MKKRVLRTFLILALVLLLIDWILGVARFRWEALHYAFLVLNLPSSLGFEWLDSQPAAWWRETARLEPEVGSAIAFLGMVGVQAALWSVALSSRGTRNHAPADKPLRPASRMADRGPRRVEYAARG